MYAIQLHGLGATLPTLTYVNYNGDIVGFFTLSNGEHGYYGEYTDVWFVYDESTGNYRDYTPEQLLAYMDSINAHGISYGNVDPSVIVSSNPNSTSNSNTSSSNPLTNFFTAPVNAIKSIDWTQIAVIGGALILGIYIIKKF